LGIRLASLAIDFSLLLADQLYLVCIVDALEMINIVNKRKICKHYELHGLYKRNIVLKLMLFVLNINVII